MWDGWDISDGNELLFVERFANENYFAAALHEGGIAGVVQDDNDTDYENRNTNEDPDKPPGIVLDPASARGKIARFSPENPVELPVFSTSKNPVELLGLAPL